MENVAGNGDSVKSGASQGASLGDILGAKLRQPIPSAGTQANAAGNGAAKTDDPAERLGKPVGRTADTGPTAPGEPGAANDSPPMPPPSPNGATNDRSGSSSGADTGGGRKRDSEAGSASGPKGDRWGEAGDAIRFLQAFDAGGRHNLVAFDPMIGPPIDGKTFPPNAWQPMADWINDHVARGHNLYFSVNEPKPGSPNKKLEKTDIGYIRAIPFDKDPQGGPEELDADRERLRGEMDEMLDGILPPSSVVDSGGGYQAHFKIKKVKVTNENMQLAETVGDGLSFRFKGDAVGNIDRIMRLPGTPNIPNAKKRRKGRTKRMATVYRETDAIHHLETLADEFPPPPERDRPKSKIEEKEWQKYRDTIDMEAVRACPTYDDLPAALRERFEEALQKSAALRALWERGEKKEGSDRTGSGYVASLGFHLARLGFPLQDFAHLAWVWERTPGSSGRAVNARPRALSRVWAKALAVIATEDQNSAVARINQTRAVVLIKGKTRILLESTDSETGLPSIEYASVHDQQDFFANDLMTNGKPAFGEWLRSPERRQYTSVVFEPGKPPMGNAGSFYNLWRGLIAPDPAPNPAARCALFLSHLHDNVCRGEEERYRWLLGWMAQMVQQPAKKTGVAVVLRGGRGVGKSIVGKYLGAVCPGHHVVVANPNLLIGHFNAHLASALLIQAEEAVWAGDKIGESVLKDIITGDTRMVEPKGVDAFPLKNYSRLLKTSNESWVVPAGHDERRIAMLNVGEDRKQDHPYFEAIDNELAAGGANALLAFLQAFDLSTVNARQAPATDGLLEQKLHSLKSEERWLYECLREGALGNTHSWPAQVECEGMYQLYQQSTSNKEWPATKEELGKTLIKILPGARRRRRRAGSGARFYAYDLPELEKARGQFSVWIGYPVVWDVDGDEDEDDVFS